MQAVENQVTDAFRRVKILLFTHPMAKASKPQGNKYAHLSGPQATFDFHGRGLLMADDICSLAKTFVQQSFQRGMTNVLIITGKGLHSHRWFEHQRYEARIFEKTDWHGAPGALSVGRYRR